MPGKPTPRGTSAARTSPAAKKVLRGLAARVRSLRQQLDLTQEQAAEAAKLDDKHWQAIEGGRTNPTVATLVAVARALRVDVADLFTDD